VSFRTRLALVAAVAVALAVVAASAVVFIVVRNQLRGELDDSIRSGAEEIARGPLHIESGPGGDYLDPGPFFNGVGYIQAVRSDGKVYKTFRERGSLPVTHRTLAAAAGSQGPYFADARIGDVEWRVFTFPENNGYALQIARSLGEINHTLHRVTLYLLLIALGGILVAAALGLAVARTALAPVRRLTETAENVTETGDLSQRIEVASHDELGRLAASFNTMLAALEEASRAQRQLVADASHELRTPLTSLRTNIEVLAGDRALQPGDREKLLGDVVEQLGEMTSLIAELIELARAEQTQEEPEYVRLDLLTEGAVERAQRNRPNVTFRTDIDESLVHGVPSTIERAVGNLLDNAAKWSPPGGEVEVGVHGREVTVRDHGAGIAEEDLPYVFDRFYRASSARGLPGSGLGLAIVKQVAEAHGGTVTAERPEGGGTLMRLRLNGASPTS
jgi:two-component system, OmpR family, sensor histidine kinase MprB